MQADKKNSGATRRGALFLFAGFVWLTTGTTAFADQLAPGMKAFQSRDYKTADSIFSRIAAAGGDQAPSAMYMDALSLQYMGSPRATPMYRSVLTKYPYSAASTRAQTALARLDPKFLKTWLASHPPEGESTDNIGLITDYPTARVAPSFTFGTRQVEAGEGAAIVRRVESGQPIAASVSSIPVDVQMYKTVPSSYIGLNQLNESHIRHSMKAGALYTCDVIIDRVRVSNFPFRVKPAITGPVQLGADFDETFKYTVAMSDPEYSHRWQTAVAAHRKAEVVMNKAVSDNSAKGDGSGGSGPAGKIETFEIGYRTDSANNKYVKVYVDNAPVEMLFEQSSITTMPPGQLRGIASEPVPDSSELKQELTGYNSVRSSGTVYVGSIRLGRIDRQHWPVRIEAYSSARYQAPIDSTAYPRLGSDVYAEWTVQPDEAHRTLKFTRQAQPQG